MGVIAGENGAPPPAHSYPELECSVYGQAVNEYLGDDSEENRALLSLLTRELAAQRVPIAEASTALWEAAKPYLLSAANADRSSSLDDRLYEVRFDPDRISQVLVNLVGNAIRHGGGGWVEVTTSKVGDEAVVKVQDGGSGIPAQKLEHIFEAFVQLSTGTGRKVGGTGLGLAICKQIIELHGGRIWVESEVGKGSAFYFALRLADDNETEGS